jgi:hypothetical protein
LDDFGDRSFVQKVIIEQLQAEIDRLRNMMANKTDETS